jgi:putative DNA primase/helicase
MSTTAPDLEDLDRQYAEEAAGTESKSASNGKAYITDLTEDGLAAEFTRRHRGHLRYIALWGTWMHWDGQRWDRETTLRAFDLARDVCRDTAEGLNNAKLRAKILSASTRSAVENLARADRAHAARVEQWDSDHFSMNAGGRTINLLTGSDRAPDPRDYMTKTAAVAPAPPGTEAPQWAKFLDRVTAGNEDLQSYLQRMAGYCLTGDVSAHALFFFYGTGANGKSVFINTLVGLLKDYACTIGTEMLMTSNTDRHPTEVARLRGVRLAVGNEVEVGRTWAESKIKALTGGDRLQGRFMRQDFFEFDPTFKLVVIGNHKPSLRGVDEAIQRRLHLVPFTVTIPPEERDPALPEKLKAEWPAILRWAIDGCLAWQRDGLMPPAAVRDATADYLAGEDTFELWRDACTTIDVNAWKSSADLWASWKRWAENAGEFVGTQKRFSQTLEERGFTAARDGTKANRRGYRGARLTRTDYTEDPRYAA